MVNLSIDLCGIKLKSPLILASGILGLKGDLLKRVAQCGAGAVTTKSVGVSKNRGYKTPNVIEPYPGIVLNAMGLPNPGYQLFRNEVKIAKEGGVPVIASVYGSNTDEFVEAAKGMEEAGADMIELNVSCPHPLRKGKLVGQDPDETAEVTRRVKKAVKIPVMVKLSPSVTDIQEIAKAAVNAGADAISAINTIKALYIDIDRGGPILSNKVGGMSGKALKPIAVRCVAEIAMQIRKMNTYVPIVGIGGISTGRDAIEMMMAGARAVGIGTAVLHYGPEVFQKVTSEITEIMKEKGFTEIEKIIGCALGEIEEVCGP
jgi:dihydroorotate dehydrogenase (NAD+) catalytic subunit